MTEFKFMQVHNFLSQLKVVEITGAYKCCLNSGLSRIVASSSNKMKHLVAAASDQAYTVIIVEIKESVGAWVLVTNGDWKEFYINNSKHIHIPSV